MLLIMGIIFGNGSPKSEDRSKNQSILQSEIPNPKSEML